MNDNRFCIIAPTYNAEKTCRQALLSIAAQSYTNWRLIVIDDMSTDNTPQIILNSAKALGVASKVDYIFNKTKKWEIENTLIGLGMCDDTDLIARVDMDDYLVDTRAFEILNGCYKQNPNLDAIWTAHCWFSREEGLTNTNISGPMENGVDVYKHPWVSSHLKTFKKHLLAGVNDENFRGENGKYFRRIGDQCFYLPVLHNAREYGYLPLVTYAYNCSQKPETFQTDDAKFQAREAQFLRARGYVK